MRRPHCLALASCVLLGACAATPPTASDAGTAPTAPAAVREGQRLDDRRPETPFTVNLLDQPVELTGSWDYTNERRENFDLETPRQRNRRVVEHELKLEARTRRGTGQEAFVQLVGLRESRRTEGDTRRIDTALERGQMWLKFDRLGGSPWALQVGRVALIDRRAFWWDDDLDAVRALYNGSTWRLDTGFGRELARVSSADPAVRPEQRKVDRWFGQATWKLPGRHQLDGFWLLQRDRSGALAAGTRLAEEDAADSSDFSGRWLGLRTSGEFRPESGWRTTYWVDAALVRGRERLSTFEQQGDGSFIAQAASRRRVRGNALDLGLTVAAPWPLRPSLSLGYARGSGGTASATRDDNFRQTGLHENKARLAGVKRLQTYGEVLRPDLANLNILRLGTGLRLLDNSSLELVHQRFRQQVASPVVTGSRLSADPLGTRRDIGHEWGLIAAFREWRHFELTLKWSRFSPGDAFAPDNRDNAQAAELGATLNF